LKKEFKHTKENHFALDDDDQAIIGQYVFNFLSDKEADRKNPFFTLCPDDDWEDKLARADNIIKHLVMNVFFSIGHVIPLGRIYEAAPEIERLYEAIRSEADRKGISIDDLKESDKKAAVYEEFNKYEVEFKYLKAEHLKFSYVFQKRQARRDFLGHMFEKYIDSTGSKSVGAQRLYKIYNQMQRYINRS